MTEEHSKIVTTEINELIDYCYNRMESGSDGETTHDVYLEMTERLGWLLDTVTQLAQSNISPHDRV